MKFDDMNPIQRRLHNAAIVLGADGDEHGFEQLQRDAIAEIERLRNIESEWAALSQDEGKAEHEIERLHAELAARGPRWADDGEAMAGALAGM